MSIEQQLFRYLIAKSFENMLVHKKIRLTKAVFILNFCRNLNESLNFNSDKWVDLSVAYSISLICKKLTCSAVQSFQPFQSTITLLSNWPWWSITSITALENGNCNCFSDFDVQCYDYCKWNGVKYQITHL